MEDKLYSHIVVKKIDLLYRKIKSRKEKEDQEKKKKIQKDTED